jgi:hypothetical protein
MRRDSLFERLLGTHMSKKKPIKFLSKSPEWMYSSQISLDKTRNKYMGFVYKIVNGKTGKFYIGQKKFWVGPKPPSKYKNKKVKESNWREYWSSCNELNEELVRDGAKNFYREILGVYQTKWDMSYNELLLQLKYDVLSPTTNTYNSYVGCRLRKRK